MVEAVGSSPVTPTNREPCISRKYAVYKALYFAVFGVGLYLVFVLGNWSPGGLFRLLFILVPAQQHIRHNVARPDLRLPKVMGVSR